MTLPKLEFSPLRTSYKFNRGQHIGSVETLGGFSRTRSLSASRIYKIPVTWASESAGKSEQLVSFWKDVLLEGQLKFRMDLYTDQSTLLEHECKFVANSFNPDRIYCDGAFQHSAILEVKPSPLPGIYYSDGTLIWFVQHYDIDTKQGSLEMCNSLEELVEALP